MRRILERPLVACAAALALAGCGSGTPTPTNPTPQPTPVATPTPTPQPTPTGIVLPPGMKCDPTPPPLLRMDISIQHEGTRVILDSKPLVVNVDRYCERVGFGDWKFCQTRPESHAQREACDYLATGKAEDTGRWGPTWIGEGKPCGAEFSNCQNHATNQFLAIAKDKGEFQACVADEAPVHPDGVRCGILGYY